MNAEASLVTTKSSHDETIRWGSIQAIVFTVAVYLVAQIAAGMLISIYPAARHWTHQQAVDWLGNSTVAQFSFVVLFEALTTGLLVWFLKRHKTSLAAIGLKKPRLRDVGYALAGFAIYLPLYAAALILAEKFLPHLNVNQKQQLGFDGASGHQLILVFISLVVLPPLVEELLVRGYLYGSLRAHWPKIYAALFASALFGVAHLEIGSGAPLLWVAAIDTFILSMVLIYLREKTDSLAASIMLHMLKNGIAFASLFILHL